MDTTQILTAVLGLVFVLGLAFITISLLKWLQLKGHNFCLCRKIKSVRHINVIEQHRLDARNSLVLAEVEGNSYLLLVGADSSILLHQKTLDGKNK